MISGQVWKREALAQSCRTLTQMGCFRVCPDLMKKLGFHPLIPIGRSLKSTSGRFKLPGTSSMVWPWAKQFLRVSPQGSGRHMCCKLVSCSGGIGGEGDHNNETGVSGLWAEH